MCLCRLARPVRTASRRVEPRQHLWTTGQLHASTRTTKCSLVPSDEANCVSAAAIHALQTGFGLDISIHTVIDALDAAHKSVTTCARVKKAIGLLLDFAKKGVRPDRSTLHTLCIATSGVSRATCLVGRRAALEHILSLPGNGSLSESVQVLCGIWQGLLPAPLLFLLVLDVLYRELESSLDVTGVAWRGTGHAPNYASAVSLATRQRV